MKIRKTVRRGVRRGGRFTRGNNFLLPLTPAAYPYKGGKTRRKGKRNRR
jgi:hypothetical protein